MTTGQNKQTIAYFRWTIDGLLQSSEGGCVASTGGQVGFKSDSSRSFQVNLVYMFFTS